MSKLNLQIATSQGLKQASFAVRAIVFCGEQNIPYSIECDEYEDQAIHIVGFLDNEPVAAGRIRFIDQIGKLERIAVRSPYRKRGYGRLITQFMITHCQNQNASIIQLHAQLSVSQMYEKCGFQAQGPIFQEADIDHIKMVYQKNKGEK